jgi:hypothetical protein
MAATCPGTRIVLGGYSQGAVVAGFATSAQIPSAVPEEYRYYIPSPMPPEVAQHVAAVVLFGKPSDEFLNSYGVPAITIGPLYQPQTIEMCVDGDTICGGGFTGSPPLAHMMYMMNDMPDQAAGLVVRRL